MNLTRENYKLIGAKLYRNPILIDSEFAQDLILMNRINNRIRKFLETGELNVRLLYNHYAIACNCFGSEYVIKVLFLLSDDKIENALLTAMHSFSGLNASVKVNEDLTIEYSNDRILNSVTNLINTELRILK